MSSGLAERVYTDQSVTDGEMNGEMDEEMGGRMDTEIDGEMDHERLEVTINGCIINMGL